VFLCDIINQNAKREVITMTQAEKNELSKLREKEEKRRKQAKMWNENAKKKWETVSCRLPLGTKKRIENAGESINGLINRLILAELDEIESRKAARTGEQITETKPETVTETPTDQEPKQETTENETEKSEEKPAITWDVLAEMQKSGNFDFSKYQ
jgi:hypothetical protein